VAADEIRSQHQVILGSQLSFASHRPGQSRFLDRTGATAWACSSCSAATQKELPMNRFCSSALSLLLVASLACPALAHFPWLAINKDGKAIYFFGEHIADRTYHLPESIAKAEINVVGEKGRREKVTLTRVESDEFVGLVSEQAITADATLVSSVTYGVYQGSRLNYYAQHTGGKMPTSLDAHGDQKPPLDLSAKLVNTDSGVEVYVVWKGQPLASAQVTLFCDEGHEEGQAKTDAAGKVSFTDRQVEEGLNGIMVGHTVKDEAGEIDGKAYQSAAHYLTVTFADPEE
jgi:hypothetical protein